LKVNFLGIVAAMLFESILFVSPVSNNLCKIFHGTLKRSEDIDDHAQLGATQSPVIINIRTKHGKTCCTKPQIERNMPYEYKINNSKNCWYQKIDKG